MVASESEWSWTCECDPALLNHGFLRVNDQPHTNTATIIVVGLARSGTSMVAAVLVSLGVPMGRTNKSTFEDIEIARALDADGAGALVPIIENRNAAHPVWGFKRPKAYRELRKICAQCRNPRVIVTFRDVLAIALRNKIAVNTEPMRQMPGLATQQVAMLSELSHISAPALLISYEKAVQSPRRTVSEIASFCGLSASEEATSGAASMVVNGRSGYVAHARRKASAD